jgi:hypothetical protein
MKIKFKMKKLSYFYKFAASPVLYRKNLGANPKAGTNLNKFGGTQ